MANKFTKCPNCGERGTMEKSSYQRTKFSVKKATIGSLIGGPIGMLFGGCLGNKKYTYKCSKCGFEIQPEKLV